MEKRQIVSWWLAVAASGALVGCGASAPVKPDANALSRVRTIAIVKAPEPKEYQVINKGSPAAGLGAVGGLAMALDARKNQKGLVGAVARSGFSFSDQITGDIENALKARGYKTQIVTAARPDPQKLLGNYQTVVPAGADAVLDTATRGVGYSTQHFATSPFWRPDVWVEVGLFTRDNKPLYGETFMFGYHNPFMSATDLDAPKAYQFDTKEAMEAANDKLLLDGLKAGTQLIAKETASRLAK